MLRLAGIISIRSRGEDNQMARAINQWRRKASAQSIVHHHRAMARFSVVMALEYRSLYNGVLERSVIEAPDKDVKKQASESAHDGGVISGESEIIGVLEMK